MDKPRIDIDASQRFDDAEYEELDAHTSAVRVNRTRHLLYKDAGIEIERWLLEAYDAWESAGRSDEIVVWSDSADIQLSLQGNQLKLECNDRVFLITPDHPQQRLTLQIAEGPIPEGIDKNFDWPLRVDGRVSRRINQRHLPGSSWKVVGTRQFRRRALAQLNALDTYPALRTVLAQVETALGGRDIPRVFMQLHVGNQPYFGPYYDNLTLSNCSEVVVLFNPYDD